MCQVHSTKILLEGQSLQARQGAVPRDGSADHVQDVICLDLISNGKISKQEVCPNSRGSFIGVWVHEGKLEKPIYRAIRTNLT